jgi:hypothetical protein
MVVCKARGYHSESSRNIKSLNIALPRCETRSHPCCLPKSDWNFHTGTRTGMRSNFSEEVGGGRAVQLCSTEEMAILTTADHHRNCHQGRRHKDEFHGTPMVIVTKLRPWRYHQIPSHRDQQHDEACSLREKHFPEIQGPSGPDADFLISR